MLARLGGDENRSTEVLKDLSLRDWEAVEFLVSQSIKTSFVVCQWFNIGINTLYRRQVLETRSRGTVPITER
jgi:hypothetical protein